MSLRRALRWTLPPLALVALAGWYRSSSALPPPAADATQPSEQVAEVVSAQGPAAQSPIAAGPDRAQAVARFVAQKNEESARDRDAFVHAGWQLVKTTPPDPKLLALDPALLASREAELRMQIASATPRAADAANLGRIAREAHEPATQAAAVDALGRIRDGGAQDQLLGLLQDLPAESDARRQVAPLLHPTDLSDPRAAKLARLLDGDSIDPVERKQIAFTLALVGLRDGSTLPSLSQLSTDSQQLIASMTRLARLSH